jgi:predicted nuclease with TOPRIM domain
MEQDSTAITFAGVARAAQVSTWLVYAEGMREHIHEAIRRQALKPSRDSRAGLTPSAASLKTDLELARIDIAKVRGERDKLRDRIRHQLGQQLHSTATADLINRINELTTQNQQLTAELRHAATETQQLRQRAAELEDDLVASRTSLRKMMRHGNATTAP